MKKLIPLVALLSLCSCQALQGFKVSESYVAADRQTFDVVAPTLRAFADADLLNDPDLSGANGTAVLTMLDTWQIRLEAAEETLEADGE